MEPPTYDCLPGAAPQDVSAGLVHPHEGITGADEAQDHPRRGGIRLLLGGLNGFFRGANPGDWIVDSDECRFGVILEEFG